MNEEKVLASLNIDEEMQMQNTVIAFIEKSLRPALVMDGGDITIHGFVKQSDNTYEIIVELVGACSTCPSASMTMKMGVERMLLQNFEYISKVSPISSAMF